MPLTDKLTHGCFVGVHPSINVWILNFSLQTNRRVEHQEVETAVRHVGGMGGVKYNLAPKVPEIHLDYILHTKDHLFVFVWKNG